MAEETPPRPPPPPNLNPSSSPCRCPRCDRTIRRAFSPTSASHPTLDRSTSSPLPAASPTSARPSSLFRNKSDVPSPSVPVPPRSPSAAVRNLALALRDPPSSCGSPTPAAAAGALSAASPAPPPAGESAGIRYQEEEMRKLREQVAGLAEKLQQLTLVAENADRNKQTCEVICMVRNGNMLEISVQCGCGRAQKVVAKVE